MIVIQRERACKICYGSSSLSQLTVRASLRLLDHGVAGYTWDDLLFDYRLMLIYRIFLPVWDAVNGSSRAYWWPKLQCLTGAYLDWHCAELLGT